MSILLFFNYRLCHIGLHELHYKNNSVTNSIYTITTIVVTVAVIVIV